MNSGLDKTSVLVTGASGGIGQATAKAFAEEGARVALHYHRNGAAAEALASELPGACALGADLRTEEQAEALFAQTLEAFGQLDTLVVNAGIWVEEVAPLHLMTLQQWQDTLEANLTSAFLCCRAFLRHLADRPRSQASIVLVASTSALFGEEGHADYSASKSAMAYGLTRTLKNEIVRLAPQGRVNCVCPGWVDTPMSASALEIPGSVEKATSTMPLRKVATSQDIAQAIVFLASPLLAGHLSGTILPVAGGMEGRQLHR